MALLLAAEKKGFLEGSPTMSRTSIKTLREFDEAVKTYINYKVILSLGTGAKTPYRHPTRTAWDSSDNSALGLCVVAGLGAGVFLWICGVDLAPLFGFLAFLVSFCCEAAAARCRSCAAFAKANSTRDTHNDI